MKNKIKIIIAIIIILTISLIFTFVITLRQWSKEKEDMISRCYAYDREVKNFGADIVDCYGYITIHSVEGHYSVNDLRFTVGTPVAIMDSLNQFKVIDNKMYVVSKKGVAWFNGVNKKYVFDFVKNNKIESVSVDSVNQIPRYLIFNTQTGDMDFYVSFEEMADDVRKVFEELKKYDQYKI